MTTQEVNEQIALLKRWRYKEGRTQPVRGRGGVLVNRLREWLDVRGTWRQHPPDSCGEWEHAGPLSAKMVDELGYHEATDWVEDKLRKDVELPEAISRAYLAWKTEEVDDED